ncbi:MAG: DUF3106 domain-containing protein [Dokdonella sp.]
MADIAHLDLVSSRHTPPHRWLALLLMAWVPFYAGAAPPAPASVTEASAAQAGARMPTLAWDSLNPQEQQVLAPLHAQWTQLTPGQQQRLRRVARRWQNAPPPRRTAIEQRLSRWATMTAEQRAALGTRYEKFSQLAPEQQQDLRDTYQRFSALPPEQRQALRERFEKMTPDERAAFAAGSETARRNQGWQRFMADMPPAERAATRAMWFALRPPERHALRRHLRALSATQRAQLRTHLLAMTPQERTAYIAQLQRTQADPH